MPTIQGRMYRRQAKCDLFRRFRFCAAESGNRPPKHTFPSRAVFSNLFPVIFPKIPVNLSTGILPGECENCAAFAGRHRTRMACEARISRQIPVRPGNCLLKPIRSGARALNAAEGLCAAPPSTTCAPMCLDARAPFLSVPGFLGMGPPFYSSATFSECDRPLMVVAVWDQATPPFL